MNCVVCEGKYDLIFIQEFIKKYSCTQGYPIDNNTNQFYDIFRSRFHPYHRDGYGCVIYGEGGKRKLFARVVIPLINEVFDLNEHRFFVVVDADGANPDNLCDGYCEHIANIIRSRQITRYSCRRPNNCYYIFFSPRDDRYQCKVKTTHLQMSLEKYLVVRGLEYFRAKIASKTRENIREMPVHDALRYLAESVDLTIDDFIKISVNEEWFVDEPWFIEINQELASFLGIVLHKNQ